MSVAVATGLTIATLAWGAFAFGAVYPWGFWSMAVLAVTAGTAGLLAAKTLPLSDRDDLLRSLGVMNGAGRFHHDLE